MAIRVGWELFQPEQRRQVFIGPSGNLSAAGGLQGGYNWQFVLGLEYLYYGLGDEALTGSIFPGRFLPVSFTWPNSNVQVARASLSYKF
jgi:hypothetical protein